MAIHIMLSGNIRFNAELTMFWSTTTKLFMQVIREFGFRIYV